jgi:hypothetical protein
MAVIKRFESYFRERQYDDKDLNRYMMPLINEGVVKDDANGKFDIISTDGNVVELDGGSAFIGGDYAYFVEFSKEFSGDTIPLTFTIPTTQDRKDSVIIRVDRDEKSISVVIKQGLSEGLAEYPTLVQDIDGSNMYEFLLYNVDVHTNGTITTSDERTYVSQKWAEEFSGAVKSTDGTFASNSDNKIPTEKATKTYITSVVGLLSNLDTNTTTNIVNAVNELVTDIGVIEGDITALQNAASGNTNAISALDTRVGFLEDDTHTHSNKTAIDAFAVGDKAKLDLIEAEADKYIGWTFNVDGTAHDKITADDVFNFISGENVTITAETADNTIKITSDNTQRSNEEIMDVVNTLIGAGTHTRVTITYNDTEDSLSFVVDPTNLSGERTLDTLTIKSSTGDNYVIPVATTELAGLFTAADKSNLEQALTDIDSIEATLPNKQDVVNLVTAWQTTPDNTHYPSEKLVKDNLDTKQDNKLLTAFQSGESTPDDEHYLSELFIYNNFYTKEDSYSSEEVDTLIARTYTYKGKVADLTALNAITGMTTGDTYYVTAEDANYTWTGTAWEEAPGTVELASSENAGLLSAAGYDKLQNTPTNTISELAKKVDKILTSYTSKSTLAGTERVFIDDAESPKQTTIGDIVDTTYGDSRAFDKTGDYTEDGLKAYASSALTYYLLEKVTDGNYKCNINAGTETDKIYELIMPEATEETLVNISTNNGNDYYPLLLNGEEIPANTISEKQLKVGFDGSNFLTDVNEPLLFEETYTERLASTKDIVTPMAGGTPNFKQLKGRTEGKGKVAYVNKTIDEPIAELNGLSLREVFESNNLVLNSSFETTNGFIEHGSNMTLNNNVLSFERNSLNTYYGTDFRTNLPTLTVGQKLKYFALLNVTQSYDVRLRTAFGTGALTPVDTTLTGIEVNKDFVFTAEREVTSEGVPNHYLNQIGTPETILSPEPILKVKQLILIDINDLGISDTVDMEYYYSLYLARKNITKKVLTYADVFEQFREIENGDFSGGTSNWSNQAPTNSTMTVENGALKVTANADVNASVTQSGNIYGGSRYYISGKFKYSRNYYSNNDNLLYVSTTLGQGITGDLSVQWSLKSFFRTKETDYSAYKLAVLSSLSMLSGDSVWVDDVLMLETKHFDESITKELLDTFRDYYLEHRAHSLYHVSNPEIKTNNKNLFNVGSGSFNGNGLIITTDSDGTITINGTATTTTRINLLNGISGSYASAEAVVSLGNLLKLNSSKSYTIKINEISGTKTVSPNYLLLRENATLIYQTATEGSVGSFSGENIYGAYFIIFSGTFNNYKISVQLEEGSVETPYVTNLNNTISFPVPRLSALDNGVTDMIHYKDGKWTYEQKIGRLVLSGTEITSASLTGTYIDRFAIPITDRKTSQSNATFEGLHLIPGFFGKTYADSLENEYTTYDNIDSDYIWLVVPKGTYVDIAAANAALIGTEIIYQLATPVITEIEPTGGILQDTVTHVEQLQELPTEYTIEYTLNEEQQTVLNTQKIINNQNDILEIESDITAIQLNIDAIETDILDLQNNKFDKTGGTISSDVTIDGDLVVNGLTTITTEPLFSQVSYSDKIVSTKDVLTPLKDGSPQLTSVEGMLLDSEQLVDNGDFSDGTTGWAPIRATGSVTNGIYSLVGDGSNASPYLRSDGTWLGGKNYFNAKVRVTNSDCTVILIQIIDGATNPTIIINTPTINTWYNISNVITVGAFTQVRIQHTYADVTTANGKVMEIDYGYNFYIDTLIANKQYSPLYSTTFDLMSDAEIKAQMDLWVNNGTLPNGIQDVTNPSYSAVGKNLFDPSLDLTTLPIAVSGQTRILELTVKPNTQYTLSSNIDETNLANIYFNGGSTSLNGVWLNKPITSTSDSNGLLVIYFRYANYESGSQTIEELNQAIKDGTNFIQLEQGDTATDYEPYKSGTQSFKHLDGSDLHLRRLPNQTHDTVKLINGKYYKIERVKAYTLQESDIANLYTSSTNVDLVRVAKTSLVGIDVLALNSQGTSFVDGFLSDPNDLSGGVFDNDIYIGYATTAISDSWLDLIVDVGTYASLAEAQADLAGTVVYYELATPIETELDVDGSLIQDEVTTIYQEHNLPTNYNITYTLNRAQQIVTNLQAVRLAQSQIDTIEETLVNKSNIDHTHNDLYEPKNVNIQAHISDTENPHGVTKDQVGLGDVDNTSDADKPVSTAQQAALDDKVDKVTGKGLSENDFTDTLKGKLDNIAEQATKGSISAILETFKNTSSSSNYYTTPISTYSDYDLLLIKFKIVQDSTAYLDNALMPSATILIKQDDLTNQTVLQTTYSWEVSSQAYWLTYGTEGGSYDIENAASTSSSHLPSPYEAGIAGRVTTSLLEVAYYKSVEDTTTYTQREIASVYLEKNEIKTAVLNTGSDLADAPVELGRNIILISGSNYGISLMGTPDSLLAVEVEIRGIKL